MTPAGDDSIVLRPWRPEDAPALAAAWADATIAGAMPVPEDCSVEAARRWILGCAGRAARRIAVDLVAVRRGEDRVLGEVGLSGFRPDGTAARIGWWVAAPERGRGVASAAVAAMARHAFGELGLRGLVATIDPANTASVAVARRVGFVPVADDLWILRANP